MNAGAIPAMTPKGINNQAKVKAGFSKAVAGKLLSPKTPKVSAATFALAY